MSNVTQDQTCCVCGSPGMTQCETGKWLCRRHSPYAGYDKEPQYNTYLKQKGIELAYLFLGVSQLVNKLSDNPNDSLILNKLTELTKLKTVYHPLPFFLMLDKLEPGLTNQFLQDKNVFSLRSVYTPEEYEVVDKTTASARFWARLVGTVESISTLKLENVMNLPGRIGYGNPDKFLGLPLQSKPSDEHSICSKCSGYGYWNIWAAGFGTRHLVNKCKECGGIGWKHPEHDPEQDKKPLNWLFIPDEQRYTWANARCSEQAGLEIRKARLFSKLSPAEFARRISVFIGDEISVQTLTAVENGTSIAYDVIYIAAGEVSNTPLSKFRK